MIVFKDDVVSDPVLVFENDVVFGVDFGSFDPVVIVIAVDFIPGGAVGPVIKVFDMIVSIIQTFLIISKSKLASQEYELFFIEHFMAESAGTMMSSLVHSALHVVPGSYLETIIVLYESTI